MILCREYDSTCELRGDICKLRLQLMHIKFLKLDRDIRQAVKNRATPAEIQNLRLNHADLCQIVTFMDDIFAPLAVFFHGGTVAGFCGETIRFIEVRR